MTLGIRQYKQKLNLTQCLDRENLHQLTDQMLNPITLTLIQYKDCNSRHSMQSIHSESLSVHTKPFDYILQCLWLQLSPGFWFRLFVSTLYMT